MESIDENVANIVAMGACAFRYALLPKIHCPFILELFPNLACPWLAGLAEDPDTARRALEISGNDVEQAVNLILTGADLTQVCMQIEHASNVCTNPCIPSWRCIMLLLRVNVQ